MFEERNCVFLEDVDPRAGCVGLKWGRIGGEKGVRMVSRAWRPSLLLPPCFVPSLSVLGKFAGTSGVCFFFSRLPPLLFSVLSKWRVTVKNTKEKNPWMYCQRMRNTSKRQGWRRSGRHWCSGRPLRRRGKQKMTDRETEREREGEKENLQMEPERERERETPILKEGQNKTAKKDSERRER